MGTSKRYSAEIRERVVRLLFEHEADHDSQWAAIEILRMASAFFARAELDRRPK
jgi:transposase-like protein